MKSTPEFPATLSALPPLTPSAVWQGAESAGSLSRYFYELAEKALAEVGMIPPAPRSSPCATAEAQVIQGPAGSPHLCDWSMDTRPAYKLSDAEIIDKACWQVEALRKCEVLKRAMQVPTGFPEVK